MSHSQVLAALVNAFDWRQGVELGIGKGRNAAHLLHNCPNLRLTGIDLFRKPHWHAKVRGLQKVYPHRFYPVQASTENASKHFIKHFFDYVFVDAGHSFDAVTTDLEAWESRIRPGGWMLGHDYRSDKYPGVTNAVAMRYGSRVIWFEEVYMFGVII